MNLKSVWGIALVVSSCNVVASTAVLYDETCDLRFSAWSTVGTIESSLSGEFSRSHEREVINILTSKGYKVSKTYINDTDHLAGYMGFKRANTEVHEPVRTLSFGNKNGIVLHCTDSGYDYFPGKWVKTVAKLAPNCIVTDDQDKIKRQWNSREVISGDCELFNPYE